MDPRNHVLDGGQHRANPFAIARSDNTAMRPLGGLLWTLVINLLYITNASNTNARK